MLHTSCLRLHMPPYLPSSDLVTLTFLTFLTGMRQGKITCASLLLTTQVIYRVLMRRNHLWIIVEYCTGGNLLQLLRQDLRFPEEVIKVLFTFNVTLRYIYI
jgi:hypothetical protein